MTRGCGWRGCFFTPVPITADRALEARKSAAAEKSEDEGVNVLLASLVDSIMSYADRFGATAPTPPLPSYSDARTFPPFLASKSCFFFDVRKYLDEVTPPLHTIYSWHSTPRACVAPNF